MGRVIAPERSSWEAMMARCHKPSRSEWKNYGGRGITVCERWKTFSNFLEDMGQRPIGTTLERVDHDGNYEPANCRWATRREQNRNSRKNVSITIAGETRLLADWARAAGVYDSVIRYRIRRGWPERLLASPADRNRKTVRTLASAAISDPQRLQWEEE